MCSRYRAENVLAFKEVGNFYIANQGGTADNTSVLAEGQMFFYCENNKISGTQSEIALTGGVLIFADTKRTQLNDAAGVIS